MKFYSTRKKSPLVGIKEALLEGLAPDGGLYMPETRPDLSAVYAGLKPGERFADMGAKIMYGLFGGDFSAEECGELCAQAFPFEPVLKNLTEGIYLLELFHGPSCAFKDFGASYLATMMQHFLVKENRKAIILTATSGDTGSAVAQAFHGKKNIEVVILYPSGRVSPSQELQLTTVGGNVHALEILGNFDDCQRMVKEAFNDRELRSRFPLTSANSINLGRLIPQSFYYAYARTMLGGLLAEKSDVAYKKEAPWFCVPSGNFGNLTAGVFAHSWGLPVAGFVAATNANDVVPHYLETGIFDARASVPTHANAMDVGNPSNFERLLDLFEGDPDATRAELKGETVLDTDIEKTMRRYFEDKREFLCPHTAVAVLASERFRDSGGASPIIALSTAHPAKFTEIVKQICGVEPEIPERLAFYLRRKKEASLLGNTLEDLSAWLKRTIAV